MALTFFHTAEANVAIFTQLMTEIAPDIPARHVVESEPLTLAVREGRVTGEIHRLTEQKVLAAVSPETRVLVCTCSTIGEVVDRGTHLHVPLLRIDRPMAERSVTFGPRVLVAACVESTIAPTTQLVRHAGWEKHGHTFEPQVMRIFEAWPLWQAGDRHAYWEAIAAHLRPVARDFDAIVLAQASMAGAADLLGDAAVPVLSSPRIGVEETVKFYRRWVSQGEPLVDDLIALLEKYRGASELERVVLKSAICAAEQLARPAWGTWRRVRFTREEFHIVPGRFELLDGVLHDKDGWPPGNG